jgi:hypothetical protein
MYLIFVHYYHYSYSFMILLYYPPYQNIMILYHHLYYLSHPLIKSNHYSSCISLNITISYLLLSMLCFHLFQYYFYMMFQNIIHFFFIYTNILLFQMVSSFVIINLSYCPLSSFYNSMDLNAHLKIFINNYSMNLSKFINFDMYLLA